MRRLMRFFENYKKQAVCAPLFKLLEALMNLFVPLVIAEMINVGIADSNKPIIFKDFAILVVLAIAGMVFSFVAQWFAANASVGFTTGLRQALFDHIQKLSYSELDKLGTSSLITRMTSDTNQIQNGINLALRLLLRSPFIVFGSVIMAFTINIKGALIFVVAVPLLSVVVFGIMLASIPLFKKSQAALDRLTEVTRENLSGVRVIRAFCKEKEEIKSFDEANDNLTRINEFTGRLSALMNPITFLIINVASIVLIKEGAVNVNIGDMRQGDVVALYNYMAQMIIELIKLASLIITINKSLACADRVADILDIEPDMAYPKTMREYSGRQEELPAVEFQNVSFSYDGSETNAVEKVDFAAYAGQTVGIIGGTGSGKSTIVNLIMRFYDTTEGNIFIDGINTSEYPEGNLIDKIGIVPQKAVLFKGTIRDNLLWGNKDATDEELWKALRAAQAEDVVKGKEGGLDAMVEQGGRNFSGGQKQRLTIARALVKKPEILIMDDSASALDFATDLALRRAVKAMEGKMTVFIVSQRTSSIKNADLILVFDDGKVCGKGTHEELIKESTVYQEIYYSQFPMEKPENKKEVTA